MERPIGIIGAMDAEVEGLIARIENPVLQRCGSIDFHIGNIDSRPVVIARCGIGKVFAAICAQAMIIRYAPRIIINTGVGGALASDLRSADIVIARSLVQYDMDTSAIGDPIGLVSGINKVFFDSDSRAVDTLLSSARSLGLKARGGVIATGDKFVATKELRDEIVANFSADVCEMEGAAIAHTAFVNETPFAVVRAISDGADSESAMDYPQFLKIAAKNSEALVLAFIRNYTA